MRTRPSKSPGEDHRPVPSNSDANATGHVFVDGHGAVDALTHDAGSRSSAALGGDKGGRAASPVAPVRAWAEAPQKSEKVMADMALLAKELDDGASRAKDSQRRLRLRNPWSLSWWSLLAVILGGLLLAGILRSFLTRQLDPKGCRMSYMRSSFVRYTDFDTEHTRFATKYNLYLYREIGIDDDARVKGVPVLFIPGNAGSYKQVRSLASEAAFYYHDSIAPLDEAQRSSKRPLDFFTVDFNEDITAFHGQTLLDQAEYLNDAIAYILSLYHTSHRSNRDPSLPDPSSVILVGHSMGGVVARTMLTMPNYQANTINTILTLSAPHARAPVSFDSQIVHTYKRINDYWRDSYSKRWSNENPLWHVTLVSIAGGGLDTIVPSDYASVASIVPETHGFTVFTSTMPNVWTGMDHLAITWCDQLRKSVVRALYDVVDVKHATQVRRRADRMRSFKRWFLSGLEDVAERGLQHQEATTLLTLENDGNKVLSQGERLAVRGFGNSQSSVHAYLMPVPPPGSADGRRFTLLTDQKHDIDLLFCSVYSHHSGHSSTLLAMDGDLSLNSAGKTRLVCKSAMDDLITLPASNAGSQWPFEEVEPFSYFQYDLALLLDYHFVALMDRSHQPRHGFAIAEFSSTAESTIRPQMDLSTLVASGLSLRLPANRPLTLEVKLPALHSSLLSYKLSVGAPKADALFAPLIRQYTSEVYESRFFVNPQDVDISLHGVAPYMPPSFRSKSPTNGLSFQLWMDPTDQSPVELSLRVDVAGSLGKLWMRYRTFFGALPLLVVALALRKQIQVYDQTGIFMSFSEGLNKSLTRSLSAAVLALVCLALSLTKASQELAIPLGPVPIRSSNATETLVDYAQNDLLLGTADGFFWFLMPAFALICFGLCVVINWAALIITFVCATVYGRFRSAPPATAEASRSPAAFTVTSTKQRIITTSILLVLVSTVIPYQFAYLVLCIVQLATVVRAWRLAMDTDSEANHNFYNYAHSVLILMLWILPINMPVLVVWIRNLAVQWLTPFSSHHNILSIMPYILLVETLTTGRLVPRLTNRLRHVTTTLLFVLALWSAIFGVSYAYQLHHLANLICAWLVVVHFSDSASSFNRLALSNSSTSVENPDAPRPKKRP